MNMKSYLSYLSSEDNYLINKDELYDDFSFDEKDIRISNLSNSPISTTNCK